MAALDGVDWRTDLDPQSLRSRIIVKIVETLRRHLPHVGEEGIELRKIATRFEEKVYFAAATETDYLRRISLKMLTIEHNHRGLNRSDQAFNIPPYDEF